MNYEIGNFVEFEVGSKKMFGKIVEINPDSEYNSYRKHPEDYPIVVKLSSSIRPINSIDISYLTFDKFGYATKWERLAGVNQLKIL